MTKIKIGNKKSGSYIDYMKHNPAETFEISACGVKTSKAVYVAAIMTNDGYTLTDFDIRTVDIGKKEPLAVLKIVLRANNGNREYKIR